MTSTFFNETSIMLDPTITEISKHEGVTNEVIIEVPLADSFNQEPIYVKDGNFYFNENLMETGRYYEFQMKGRLYLLRKISPGKIELYRVKK